MTVKALLLLNDPAYGTERSFSPGPTWSTSTCGERLSPSISARYARPERQAAGRRQPACRAPLGHGAGGPSASRGGGRHL